MIAEYLQEVKDICNKLDVGQIEQLATELAITRQIGGRVFVIGVGGSASNASHFVNDLRKLCDIEAYAPTDNVSELTARTNDDGWEKVFSGWLKVSKITQKDLLFVLSVGGGNREKNVSANIVNAIDFARERGATIAGIVGKDGGYTKQNTKTCVVIPTVNNDRITPHTEAFQAVLWHLIVWKIKTNQGKWESLAKR